MASMPQASTWSSWPPRPGDGVDEEERAAGVDEIGEPFERLVRAGAGLGVDDADEFNFRVRFEGGL